LILSFIVLAEIVFISHLFVFLPNIDLGGDSFLSAILSGVLVDVTNNNRLASNLSSLEVNSSLKKAAQAKADDMAKDGYFAHNSPDGIEPWDWIESVGYNYDHAGENLAINFSDSEDVVNAWMDSPGHRANILNKNFTEIGIGISRGVYEGEETIFVVQMFGNSVSDANTNVNVNKDTSMSKDNNIIEEIVEPGVVSVSEVIETVSTSTNVNISTTTPSVISPDIKGVEIKKEINKNSSFVGKILASPRSTIKIVYVSIFAIVLLVLMLNIFIKIKIQHSYLIINGVSLLVILSLAFALNQYFITSITQIL